MNKYTSKKKAKHTDYPKHDNLSTLLKTQKKIGEYPERNLQINLFIIIVDLSHFLII